MKGKGTTNKQIKKLTVPVDIGSDHIWGSVNAPLNIVEYGDYECPYTGMAYPIVKGNTEAVWSKTILCISQLST